MVTSQLLRRLSVSAPDMATSTSAAVCDTSVTLMPAATLSRRSCILTRSMTFTSREPAWATSSHLPSGETLTPQGLAAPRSTSSSSTVFTYLPVSPLKTESAAVFIQPRSSWVVGSW